MSTVKLAIQMTPIPHPPGLPLRGEPKELQGCHEDPYFCPY